MNILQISHEDRGGGAANSAWYLFSAYQKLGHGSNMAVGRMRSHDSNIKTISGKIPNQKFNCQLKRGLDYLKPKIGKVKGAAFLTVKLSALMDLVNNPRAWMQQQLGIEPCQYPGTRDLLKSFNVKPDIIHCHNLHGNYFDLGVLPWLSGQVPVILNLRDEWLLTGHCAYSFGCNRWVTGCGSCPDLTIPPALKRDKTCYNWQKKAAIYAQSRLYVTAPSQWLIDRVNRSMLKNVQAKVIPNGIDLSIFHPGHQLKSRLELGLPRHNNIVLFAADFIVSNVRKDYETMKQAIERLAVQAPDLKILFVCIGEKADNVEVSSKITIKFIPFEKDQTVLAKYYRASDLYIHAAKAESFGKTITEAMACQTPVVATAVGGISEQIINGKTGFLVRPAHSEEMASSMETLLRKIAIRKKMGMDAAAHVKRNFSLNLQVNRFLSWYQEVADDWKKANY